MIQISVYYPNSGQGVSEACIAPFCNDVECVVSCLGVLATWGVTTTKSGLPRPAGLAAAKCELEPPRASYHLRGLRLPGSWDLLHLVC